MNAFQWIFCALLAVAVLRDILLWRRGDGPRQLRLIRAAIWAAAIVAIANPDQLTHLANLLGIVRGADIVFYVLTLAFVAVSFFLYAQLLRLRRDLSTLASHVALREGKGGTSSEGPSTPRAS